MPRESQINGGSCWVVIKGVFRAHDPFLFLSVPLSNPQYFATLPSNSDRDCLAIKEASLSGKSDSEGTSLAPRGGAA